jgi:hypothetical protein
MKSLLSTAAVVIGAALLLISFIWGILFPPSAGWTEEKSLRLQELSRQAHVLGGQRGAASAKPNMHGGKSAAEIEEEFKRVTTELEKLGAEAEGRIEAPKTAASILRWAGIAFVVAGGLVVFATRSG